MTPSQRADAAVSFARKAELVLLGLILVVLIIAADGIGSELRECRLHKETHSER